MKLKCLLSFFVLVWDQNDIINSRDFCKPKTKKVLYKCEEL